ncbi:MAG TPA: hypothetical protein VKE93_01710 [Candidatus Angelobacter sp.]|nr:hypothetical protein [Candidatus Angelobacter sp.]
MRLKRILWQSLVMFLGLAGAGWMAPASAFGQNVTMITSCPEDPKIPVRFQIDCSHLTDPASKQLCRPFIENQACKVFPAYRKITGIKLEDKCKAILFTIYEDSNWPNPKGEGGLAKNCAVDYLEQYSVNFRKSSKTGPYDVHELLHEYQSTMGPLPSMHPLFSPSMAEATRAIGDDEQYQIDIKRMQAESKRLYDELQSGKYQGNPKECSIAQAQVEERLYLENPKLVSMYYLKLPPAKGNSQAERDARFNQMFYVLSGPKPEVKKFLTDHCGKF